MTGRLRTIVGYHFGMLLAKKGKNKEATAELKAALSLDLPLMLPGAGR